MASAFAAAVFLQAHAAVVEASSPLLAAVLYLAVVARYGAVEAAHFSFQSFFLRALCLYVFCCCAQVYSSLFDQLIPHVPVFLPFAYCWSGQLAADHPDALP